MSGLICVMVRPAVRWFAAEGSNPPDPVRRHVARCVRCQAEAVRVRTTIRSAAGAFVRSEAPPSGLVGAVMAGTLQGTGDIGRSTRTRSLVAAVAAGTALFVIYRARLSSS